MYQNNSTAQPHRPGPLAVPVLLGAGIGLLMISFFVFSVDHPHPEWGKLWMIRPLIITPAAGAMGGAFYYVMDHLSNRGLNRSLAVILSLIVFIIGVWLGIILGLSGTLWN